MAVNQENLQTLDFYLQKTLDPNREMRIKGEEYLKTMHGQPGYCQLLLKYSELENYSFQVRTLAAICAKNYISKFWVLKREALNIPNKPPVVISDHDKAEIKHILPSLVLTSHPKIGKILLGGLTFISNLEWPNQWPELLPSLISKLDPNNFQLVNTILKCINACCHRYRSVFTSDDVIRELLYILNEFQEPMLQIFNYTVNSISEQAQNEQALKILFTSCKLLINIFYTLNYIELPEYFEDHMNEYMTGFRSFLVYKTESDLLNGDDDDRAGLLQKVQSGVFDCISLYVEKYEEEFQPYLETFATDTFNLLSQDLSLGKYDTLVTNAISFLTSISKGVCHTLFKEENTLNSLCKDIIVKNTIMGEFQREQFEDDPIAFIQRDVEGSDSNTRRRAGAELIKGLRKNYQDRVTNIIGGYISEMISQYKADPANNWVIKDAAIYLITAIASEGETQRDGIKVINPNVPVASFYQSEVIPELQRNANEVPILKAACLKFVNRFRMILGGDSFDILFPTFIAHLQCNAEVTRSYAATCIERILTIREENQGAVFYRYGKEKLSPHLNSVFNALFYVLSSASDQSSMENQYIMKAILRVITVAKEEAFGVYQTCLTSFASILQQIYRAPTNTLFCHYLFETIACIVRNINQTNPSNISMVETTLFQIFTGILQDTACETLHPYVFQIFGLLLEAPAANITLYQGLLPAFLELQLWTSTDSVPSLARIVEAYISKLTNVVGQDQLQQILNIFSLLVENKHTDHLGFDILISIVNNIELNRFESNLPDIFRFVFARLSTSKTNVLVRSFIVFLAHFIVKYDASYVFSAINSIQDNISDMVINSLWLEYVLGVEGDVNRKLLAIASTKIFCEYSKYISPEYEKMWLSGIQKIVEIIETKAKDAPPVEEPEVIDQHPGEKLTFSPLSFAQKTTFDPAENIDPRAYFVQALMKIDGAQQMIGNLPQDHQKAIQSYLG
eukprot:TRINITY_DN4587_c0_g1_i1.p1 TRINITY_DN4587_c0_g1~~TRINITY_DN4587_c0_g1_i1.p1  ORF type:complete len:967 (-),score=208.33 TRINITY_DN4587_c0_g1_i1:132-3032(-)